MNVANSVARILPAGRGARVAALAPVAYFALLQIAVLIALLPDPNKRVLLFWYCNNAAFFYAIAFWQKNTEYIRGINLVGILPQLLWVFDLVSPLFGLDLSDTANYVYAEGLTFSNNVSIILHTTMPFVALWYVYRARPTSRAIGYALLYIAGLYVTTLSGTGPGDNVNCVFTGCAHGLPYPSILWPIYMAVLVLGAFGLHYGLFLAARRFRSGRQGEALSERAERI